MGVYLCLGSVVIGPLFSYALSEATLVAAGSPVAAYTLWW